MALTVDQSKTCCCRQTAISGAIVPNWFTGTKIGSEVSFIYIDYIRINTVDFVLSNRKSSLVYEL